MRNSWLRWPLVGTAAFALLSGCASRSAVPAAPGALSPAAHILAQRQTTVSATGATYVSVLPPSRQKPRVTAAVAAKAIPFSSPPLGRIAYVSDASANFIDVFGWDGTLTARITDGLSAPEGIFVDNNHNLWVANSGDWTIREYPRGATTASRVINDTDGEPVDVAVGKDGTVYASNIVGPSGPIVSVYPPGSSVSKRWLADPDTGLYGGDFFIAVDDTGTVYLDILDSAQAGHVDKFVNGRQAGFKRLPILFLLFPGGIKTYNGNILVADQLRNVITEYTSEGKKTGTVIFTGGGWPQFALTQSAAVIFGADSTWAPVQRFAGETRSFPGGSFQRYFNDGNFQLPLGAAVDPAQ